jgi:asparagine synthase (glutamine-hydrolysing)
MCGLAGRSAKAPMHERFAQDLATRFTACLHERGPNGTGWYHDGETLLAHSRLAIIDLSEAALQPLWNEDRTVAVIANGEIYNFGELRRSLERRGHRFRSGSDCEVIVHLYEDGDIDACCEALRGMFAFALWDERSRDLYLVRDRLGIKPLVVAEHTDGVTFGSTRAALLVDGSVPTDIRHEALASVLKWGFVPTPWSALRSARHVLPGSWIRIRGGRVVGERRWWIDRPAQVEASAEEMRAVLERAVASHLVADVPVGVLLSGGIDSGVVAALATCVAGRGALEGWTASQPGFGEDEWDDACRTAHHVGLSLHEVPLGMVGATPDLLGRAFAAMDEPLAVSSLVGLHALFAAIAPKCRVVLSGDGGDELFGGYGWHVGMPLLPQWSRSPAFQWIAATLHRRSSLGQLAALARKHPAALYLDKLRMTSDAELADLGIDPAIGDPMEERAMEAWDRFAEASALERMLAVDRATALVDEMLAKVDTASMASGVEARVPFLADDVVAAAKGLPSAAKRAGAVGKVFLREWFRELGPANAHAREKTGFNSPLATWFEGPAAAFLHDHAQRGGDALGVHHEPRHARARFALAVMGAYTETIAGARSLTAREGGRSLLHATPISE